MFFLVAGIMTSLYSEKQYHYFWDHVKELSIQSIVDQTVWINQKIIKGPQKLGSHIELIAIYPNGVEIKFKNQIIHIGLGKTVKLYLNRIEDHKNSQLLK